MHLPRHEPDDKKMLSNIFYAELSVIEKLIGAVKASVKRRDAFHYLKSYLKLNDVIIPSLDVDIRW